MVDNIVEIRLKLASALEIDGKQMSSNSKIAPILPQKAVNSQVEMSESWLRS